MANSKKQNLSNNQAVNSIHISFQNEKMFHNKQKPEELVYTQTSLLKPQKQEKVCIEQDVLSNFESGKDKNSFSSN